jgi:hypothetical protein
MTDAAVRVPDCTWAASSKAEPSEERAAGLAGEEAGDCDMSMKVSRAETFKNNRLWTEDRIPTQLFDHFMT